MALQGYGVLRGKVVEGKREKKADSPHYQIHLVAGGIHYRIAVNVKSQVSPSELLFLVNENFNHPLLDGLDDLAVGFTPLLSKPNSGALDFIRGNLFPREDMRTLPFDLPGQDNDLNDKIEYFINRARLDANADIFVFGVRWGPETAADKVFKFKPGNGVHDIHMNQGNSASFAGDDGVWQDGGMLIHFPGLNQWVAVFLAFQSQAWHTDDQTGHTIPVTVPAPVPTPSPTPAPNPVPGPLPIGNDLIVRILAAMVNPQGPAPEKETVVLLNTSPQAINLTGWTLADKMKNKQKLTGSIAPGSPLVVAVKAPVQLGNNGGLISLLDNSGLKVDGVAYTAADAGKEGWLVVF
jgi:uncharacterized protein YukJ